MAAMASTETGEWNCIGYRPHNAILSGSSEAVRILSRNLEKAGYRAKYKEIGGLMNKVVLMGRLTADPETRATQDGKAVGTYTLAVDRRVAKGDQKTDFIRCQVWERKAEFAEKYLHKGTKIVVTGRIQTGSYKDKDGKTVYTTDVVIEDQEFAESKLNTPAAEPKADDGFIDIPVGGMEGLPFN